ncbi:peptidase A2 domain-containing protein [Trichonephila clavipes]|uniref:Peptidase A2 domain-containing protein n=1 Tax=Trichonephila clavipes TaxID=2585209 RepID=A0A8X6RLN2_TRICX|nr:peptidase A2 domain-containing protein [Trichonephila clavipes]
MLNEDSKNLEMSAVSIKIPPFWTDRPEIWFYQVEAQFQISRISLEETKFHYLVSQLEPKYVENIWDIVNSKSDTKYTDSKNRLLSLFKESENLRIKRLLTGIELGDMKPSQLLQKVKTVATSDISDNLIKTLWLEKLPESIKNILVVSDENLSKLASAVNIATNSAAEDYKACRKFRLFVKDRTTNLHFLVDSGADCSIIPATSKNKQPSDYKLFAANGTEIPTYGIKVLNIDLGLRREFLFPFIIAKVSKGILGADF